MMPILRKLRRALGAIGSAALSVLTATAVWAQPPAGQEAFVPVRDLPASEQLPGGAFVVVAYGFVWIATILYVYFLWQRMNKVERDMQALERRSSQGSARR